MKILRTFIERTIAGEYYLVPIGEAAKDYSLIAVSESGAFIWRILPECDSLQDVVDKILDEYEIDEKTAREDADEFLTKLKELKII